MNGRIPSGLHCRDELVGEYLESQRHSAIRIEVEEFRLSESMQSCGQVPCILQGCCSAHNRINHSI